MLVWIVRGWLFMILVSIENRAAVPSTIEVPAGFEIRVLATNLNAATAFAASPDGRIFIAEQTGLLRVWKEGHLLPQPALKLEVTDFWERGLIGVALDPSFPASPQIFLLYVKEKPFPHHVLSRFMLSGDVIDPGSERVLLEGDDQQKIGGQVPAGHQGGPLCFGPDGKLYVSIGEQTQAEASQRLDTLQGKILRLNPDGSIPEDNPFFSRTSGKYRSIYAYGVRNCYGLSMDIGTKRMLFTDVGGSAFEEVNELIRGANYGWPLAEGSATNSEFRQPLHAYPPVVGRSVAGGGFAPATGLPEKWRGRFFFADYMSHWVKAMNPSRPTNILTFARGLDGPVALGFNSQGNLLLLNRGSWVRDRQRFVPNTGTLLEIRYTGGIAARPREEAGSAALGVPMAYGALPSKLSGLQIHNLVRRLQAVPGVLPIELNCPPWEPGVEIRRWVALLPNTKLKYDASEPWGLPAGAVMTWHVIEAGSGRRVETRILVRTADGSYGASYRWRNNGADADLVEEAETVSLPVTGRLWFLPAPEPRMNFPVSSLSFPMELTTRQLAAAAPSSSAPNRLMEWRKMGVLDCPLSDEEIVALPGLAPPQRAAASLELRVRSYLDVNCAICHQPGGNSRGFFDARFTTPLEQSGIINGALAAGDLGITGARVVLPGDPERSMLSHRLRRTDFFRMPPMQYHKEHSPIIPVLNEWIFRLPR